MGRGATEQDTIFLAQSLQNGFALHCSRNSALKGPSGKPCKCLSKHSHQTRACAIISLCRYLWSPAEPSLHTWRFHVSWNSTNTALSCTLHLAMRSGEEGRLCKKEHFVTEKKGHHLSGQQSESDEMAKQTIPLLRGVLYLDDKFLWLNCFWLPSCVSLVPVYLHCCTGENYGKVQ